MTDETELLHWIEQATKALDEASQSSSVVRTKAEELMRLEAGHAQAKMDAVARMMEHNGMTATKAESYARTDPEFAKHCIQEAELRMLVNYWETNTRHLIEKAKLARVVIGVLSGTTA